MITTSTITLFEFGVETYIKKKKTLIQTAWERTA